jgi:hypothetical protein
MTQAELSALWNQAPAVRHSETSKAAAEDIQQCAGTLRAKVLGYLKASGPASDEAMQRALHMGANTQRPRRRELELAGLVRDSGKRTKTSSGRSAVLWIAVEP